MNLKRQVSTSNQLKDIQKIKLPRILIIQVEGVWLRIKIQNKEMINHYFFQTL